MKVLTHLCRDFGVPATLTTDGGPQFVSGSVQEFLQQHSIHHRLTSVAFPHANCRAEVAVKTAKRLILDNVQGDGRLDSVRLTRALLQYRNTPDRASGMSPAELLLGRQLRDFLPGAALTPPHFGPTSSARWPNSTGTEPNRKPSASVGSPRSYCGSAAIPSVQSHAGLLTTAHSPQPQIPSSVHSGFPCPPAGIPHSSIATDNTAADDLASGSGGIRQTCSARARSTDALTILFRNARGGGRIDFPLPGRVMENGLPGLGLKPVSIWRWVWQRIC